MNIHYVLIRQYKYHLNIKQMIYQITNAFHNTKGRPNLLCYKMILTTYSVCINSEHKDSEDASWLSR